MLGSLLSRAFIMAFGYAYPAYKCYKSVEMNKPDLEMLRFWCKYWILIAILTAVERIGDLVISWLPMYNEAKLAFFIYLWHPRTMGTVVVYNGFFQPYISQHEADIDENLLELRVKATDAAFTFWRQGATYGQARFFELLQYFATQSHSLRNRHSARSQQEQKSEPPPIVTTRQSSARHRHQQEQQQGPSAMSARQYSIHRPESDVHAEEKGHHKTHRVPRSSHVAFSPEQQPSSPVNSSPTRSQSSEAAMDDALAPPHVPLPTQAEPSGVGNENMDNSESSGREGTSLESPSSSENEDTDSKDVIMEDTVRVTRARLRKNVSLRTSSVDPESGV